MTAGLENFFFGPAPIVWLQQTVGPGWSAPFRALSLLGDTWGVLLVLGLTLWLWGRQPLYALIPLMALEGASFLLLNQLLGIPRPSDPAVIKYEHLSIGAFPSGHVYMTTVLWGFLYARGRLPLAIPVAAVVGVAAGRLYLGVHHLGDVLGGAVLGVALVYVYVRLWPPLRGWLERRSFAFYVGVALVVGVAVTAALPFIGVGARWWRGGGMIVGAALALPLEYRYLRYAPGDPRVRTRLLRVLLGLDGILLGLLLDQLFAGRSAMIGAAAMLGATLWALLLAPALFQWLGLAAPRDTLRRTRTAGGPHARPQNLAAPNLERTGPTSSLLSRGGLTWRFSC